MSMHELTSKETESISGGTTYGSWVREIVTHPSNSYSASTHYGGQANGFVSNTAAIGRGLFQGNCSNNVAAGVLGGALTGPKGVVVGAFAGAIAGGCFKR